MEQDWNRTRRNDGKERKLYRIGMERMIGKEKERMEKKRRKLCKIEIDKKEWLERGKRK